jgi:hypothetical protein
MSHRIRKSHATGGLFHMRDIAEQVGSYPAIRCYFDYILHHDCSSRIDEYASPNNRCN